MLLCQLVFFAVPTKATNLTEVWDLFSITVSPGWVYQIQESTETVMVFYGPGEQDLIYIENLGLIVDQSAMDFAQRVIAIYEGTNGLPEFCIRQPITARELAGVSVAEVVYHYQGRQDIVEKRIFMIYNSQGISITYSNALEHYLANQTDFNNFLNSWRWLELE